MRYCTRIKPINSKASNEETQEILALVELLAMGQRDVVEGRLTPLDEAMARIRADLT